jgi:hypothetical protein
MADNVVYGLSLQVFAGQNLKYGAVAVMVAEHVAASNRQGAVALGLMLVKLLESLRHRRLLFVQAAAAAVL